MSRNKKGCRSRVMFGEWWVREELFLSSLRLRWVSRKRRSLAADQIWRYRRSFAIANLEQMMRIREAELNKFGADERLLFDILGLASAHLLGFEVLVQEEEG